MTLPRLSLSFFVAIALAMTGGACGGSSSDEESIADQVPCDGDVYRGTLSVLNAKEMKRMEGIQCLKGNLVIGADRCRGAPKPLPDLSALKSLEVVEGDIIISTASGALTGLENIKRAKRLRLCNSPDVDVVFPSLRSSDVVLQGIETARLPALEQANLLSLQSDRMTELDLPRLSRIRRIAISNSAKLERISAPELVTTDLFELSNIPRFEGFIAPKLAKVSNIEIRAAGNARDRAIELGFLARLTDVSGRIEIDDCKNIKVIDLGQLQSVKGVVSFRQMQNLQSLNLASLKSAESVVVANVPSLQTLAVDALKGAVIDFEILDAPKLQGSVAPQIVEVNGKLAVQQTGLKAIKLSSLKSVRGTFRIDNNPRLTTLDASHVVSIGGDVIVKDNAKLPVKDAASVAEEGPRFQQCGQLGGAPCSFAPPKRQYEALPTSLRFIRDGKYRAYASERADVGISLGVLKYLGAKQKKVAKKTPTIFVRSRVSDALVVVRGRKGTGPVTEWLWLRPVPSRGYSLLAKGKPKSGDSISTIKAFVDFDDAIVLGKLKSKRRSKSKAGSGLVAVYRLNRRTAPKSERRGTVDISRAKDVEIAKKGLGKVAVGIRDGALEVRFGPSGDDGLPLVFRQPRRGRTKFKAVDSLGTALSPGETRADAVNKDAKSSVELPRLSRQTKATATAKLGEGCISAIGVPKCPEGTTPSPAGPPTSNIARCRRPNGIEQGPFVHWYQRLCPAPKSQLFVRAHGNYKDGREEGVWTFYRRDGIPLEQTTFVDGEKTGFQRRYNDKGAVEAEGTLDNGTRVGKWKVLRKGRLRTKNY